VIKTEKRDFRRCQICGAPLGKIEFDSPLYCEKCIEEMEKNDLSPEDIMLMKKK